MTSIPSSDQQDHVVKISATNTQVVAMIIYGLDLQTKTLLTPSVVQWLQEYQFWPKTRAARDPADWEFYVFFEFDNAQQAMLFCLRWL